MLNRRMAWCNSPSVSRSTHSAIFVVILEQSSFAISVNTLAITLSPMSTETWLSQTEFSVGSPRRVVARSTTSSWISVAVWQSSMMNAASMVSLHGEPYAEAERKTSAGLSRLPLVRTR